jgi:hypothetical protein
MAIQVQFRGGTTAEHSTFTGAAKEVTVDTTKKTLVVHDGSTAGGIPVAKAADTVNLTGAQTVAGVKTFSSDQSVNGLTVGRGAGAVASNTAVGASALAGTGAFNVAVGFQALDANTTGNTLVAVGHNSLGANTTGELNTAVGQGSLQTNTTGNGNTAVGVAALSSNTTAANNTAVGYEAGFSQVTAFHTALLGYQAGYATTVGDITAVGSQALVANTTGNSNTGVGRLALKTNTTGSYNTAVGGGEAGSGYSALNFNTTGSQNVAMGNGALGSNTTASNNTAVGYQAGFSGTTTLDNTFVGYQSGYSVTTGSGRHAFFGKSSGYSNTTGTDNIAIGYFAGFTNQTGNANVYIGSGLFGAQLPAGYNATGSQNTFVGYAAGNAITTGAKNTILGGYNGNQGGLDIRTASNYIVLSDGDGNPRGVFDNSGNLLVGNTANPSSTVAGTLIGLSGPGGRIILANTLTATYQGVVTFINGNGTVGEINTNGSATTYATSSDYRLKNTIAPMTGALAKVALLKPCTYKWNADGSDGEGFIAHELAEVVPQCVTGEKDAVDAEGNPKYQGIDTSFLVATLTAAIQELKAEFDAYKASHP